jgi:hypothetical protein
MSESSRPKASVFVMAGGVWHVRDGRQQVFGRFEANENN